jgi:hypothetical protein
MNRSREQGAKGREQRAEGRGQRGEKTASSRHLTDLIQFEEKEKSKSITKIK